MRQIAARAGVNNSTVSLALRHSPLISEATRQRIQTLADRMGYRPDPEVARLMHHLRQRHKPRFKSVVVGLTTVPEGDEQQYLQRVWSGAVQKAQRLGYGVSLVRAEVEDLRRGSFWRMLRNRGVEGLVLLPQRSALMLEENPEWNWFSVVVATHSIRRPRFHRVVPDQFGNTLSICQHLEHMGRRRIGLLLQKDSDLTVDHRISGAVAWQNTLGGTEPVAPLVYDDDYAPKLAAWFKREKPDALVVGTEAHAHRIAKILRLTIPGRVVFAVTDGREPHVLPGMDQRPEDVGAAALTVLNGQLASGERGIPPTQHFTMIQGVWHDGTLPTKKS
jgi:DNA-binding LacI/PurR family transcriptional regulator